MLLNSLILILTQADFLYPPTGLCAVGTCCAVPCCISTAMFCHSLCNALLVCMPFLCLLSDIALHMLHDAALCYAMLRCAVLCFAVLCYVMLYAMMRCALLVCSVLCCAVLCCAVLCCAVLCYAMLCLSALYCFAWTMPWLHWGRHACGHGGSLDRTAPHRVVSRFDGADFLRLQPVQHHTHD